MYIVALQPFNKVKKIDCGKTLNLPMNTPAGIAACEELVVGVTDVQEAIGLLSHKNILDTVSLKMYAEHITVLLGRNGSGKSLILKMITGLARPSEGTVCVGGWDVGFDLYEVRKRIGFCPQNLALFMELTVEENLTFFSGVSIAP